MRRDDRREFAGVLSFLIGACAVILALTVVMILVIAVAAGVAVRVFQATS